MHATVLIDGACWATWTTRIYPRSISQRPSHQSSRTLQAEYGTTTHPPHPSFDTPSYTTSLGPTDPPYRSFPALDEVNLIPQIAKHVSPFEPSHYVLRLAF